MPPDVSKLNGEPRTSISTSSGVRKSRTLEGFLTPEYTLYALQHSKSRQLHTFILETAAPQWNSPKKAPKFVVLQTSRFVSGDVSWVTCSSRIKKKCFENVRDRYGFSSLLLKRSWKLRHSSDPALLKFVQIKLMHLTSAPKNNEWKQNRPIHVYDKFYPCLEFRHTSIRKHTHTISKFRISLARSWQKITIVRQTFMRRSLRSRTTGSRSLCFVYDFELF